ncbi:MAG: MFS transporter [Actinomycetota bacterium]|nr:MFS transporter [Actinomycetota bacterium]
MGPQISEGDNGGAPPRRSFYYGWAIAGTLAVTETASWGALYYAFAVFLVPMQEELGWSRTAMTGAYSLGLLVSGLAAPLVGRWLDWHGPRGLMTLGSIAGAALLLTWASVEDLLVFYLVWVGIGLAMAATLYEPAFAVLAKWFRRGRARALLLVTLAGGLASTIFLPLSAWLVEVQGWRGALFALAAILAILTILPHALVLRRSPEDLGLLPDGIEPKRSPREETEQAPNEPRAEPRSVPLAVALRGPAFWLLAAALFLGTLSQAAMYVHLIPYLAEKGYGLGSAATLTGLIGASQVLGRVVLTFLEGHLPRDAMMAGIFALQAVALVVLIGSRGPLGVLMFVLPFGAASGAVTISRALAIADFYGPAHYGSIGGVVGMFVTGARTLAPVGAGALSAALGSYAPVLWTLTFGSALAAIAMFIAQRLVPPLRFEPYTNRGR